MLFHQGVIQLAANSYFNYENAGVQQLVIYDGVKKRTWYLKYSFSFPRCL